MVRRYSLAFLLGLSVGISMVNLHGYTHRYHSWSDGVCVHKDDHEALKKKSAWIKTSVLPYLGERTLIVGDFLHPVGAQLVILEGKTVKEWKTDTGEVVPLSMVDFWRPMPPGPIWDRATGKVADNGELIRWN